MTMTGPETERFLGYILDIARQMLESGAEVRRAEDTMTRICTAYGFTVLNSFAILTMVQLTVRAPDGTTYTQSVRVVQAGTDLGEIERLNADARQICLEKPDLDAIGQLIAPRPAHRKRWIIDLIGYLLTSGGFGVFFGGSLRDGAAAAVIGAVIFFMDHFLQLRRQNRIIYTVIACFISGCLAELSVLIGFAENADKVMIGDVMLFIPTLAIVNGVKEMFYRDMTTGLCRFTEALLVAASIAGGFATAILLFGGMRL